MAGSERGLATDAFSPGEYWLVERRDVARGKRCVVPPYGRMSCCSSCEHSVEKSFPTFCVFACILGKGREPRLAPWLSLDEVADGRGTGMTVTVPVCKRFALEEPVVIGRVG